MLILLDVCGHIYANEASSISIMGSGSIDATISGAQAQTINIDVGSAGIGAEPNIVAIGTRSAKTLNVSSKGDIYLAPDPYMILSHILLEFLMILAGMGTAVFLV